MATYYPKYYYHDSVGMGESMVKPVFHQRVIDFATQNLATSDVVNMIAIPAQTLLLTANYQTITTVTSASSSFAIITNSAATNKTLVTAAVAVAAGSYGVPAAISTSTTNLWCPANDDIQIGTITVAGLTVGQLRVFALLLYPQPLSYVDVDGNTKTYTFTDRNNWTTTAPTIPQ